MVHSAEQTTLYWLQKAHDKAIHM